MMGHGKVPWPFVRRSRFVKELESQGRAYRANVWAADQAASQARNDLRKAEREFFETVRSLSGWQDGDTTVRVEDAGGLQHFRVEVVHDLRGRRHSFVYDISDSLLCHIAKTLRPDQAGRLMFVVTEGLVAQVLTEMFTPPSI